MSKLVLCGLAMAVGVYAQEGPILRKWPVSPGPAAHADAQHLADARPSTSTAAAPLATGGPAGPGIVYTCDPTLTALSPTICNTLNTTIAGLYRTVFTNANASIYIKLGNTALGESESYSNGVNYSTFRGLMIAAETDPEEVQAVTDSLPATNPFGNDIIYLNTALQRALNYANPTAGVNANGSSCNTNGAAGCYDGLITISNSQPLYLRTGTILGKQYDFYSVVQHETDEVLGTGSCAFQDCSGNSIAPSDYFRYHSNGTRSFGLGTNDPCTQSDSTNACFSLDGIHVLQQFNNLSGDDAGDWVLNCPVPRVQDEELCSGTAGVDISPSAEILLLSVIGYARRTPSFEVLSAANPASPWLAPGSLASAYGTGTDFATSTAGSTPVPLPTTFGGSTVSIRDAAGVTTLAPLVYVAPTQVNFLVPPGVAAGAAQATISSGDGTQSIANVQIAAVAPGLFALNLAGLAAADVVIYHANGTQTVEQVYAVNSAGAVVATPVSLGSGTDQAYLFLFGTGLQAAGTARVTASVGGYNLAVQYAGPQGGYAGLDQVNVKLPASLAGKGNVTIQVTANNYATNLVNITVQ